MVLSHTFISSHNFFAVTKSGSAVTKVNKQLVGTITNGVQAGGMGDQIIIPDGANEETRLLRHLFRDVKVR